MGGVFIVLSLDWTVEVAICDVFFFKQNTAYEVRISDWSSDVCSSDLIDTEGWGKTPELMAVAEDTRVEEIHAVAGDTCMVLKVRCESTRALEDILHRLRSEEHTSELQSLMRISYAVFCLKKKKKKQTITMYNSTDTNNN